MGWMAVWSTTWKNSQSSSAGAVKANVHLTARTHEKHETNIHILAVIIQIIFL